MPVLFFMNEHPVLVAVHFRTAGVRLTQ